MPHGTYTDEQVPPHPYRSNGIDITDSVISARGDERTGRHSGHALQSLSVSCLASLRARDDFGVVTRSLREALGLTRHADPCDATRQPFLLSLRKRENQALSGWQDPPNGYTMRKRAWKKTLSKLESLEVDFVCRRIFI